MLNSVSTKTIANDVRGVEYKVTSSDFEIKTVIRLLFKLSETKMQRWPTNTFKKDHLLLKVIVCFLGLTRMMFAIGGKLSLSVSENVFYKRAKNAESAPQQQHAPEVKVPSCCRFLCRFWSGFGYLRFQ